MHFPFPCGCRGHMPRLEGFLIPCLLLLLKEKPAHGYELVERLGNFSFLEQVPDPGVVYRHLRRLEEEGMVASRLEPGSGGPARKVYSLSPEGEDYLRAWAYRIHRQKGVLEGFLQEFFRLFPDDKGSA
ncbi:MAG: helix-turn-helix transcriptional regulator [Clostridia bacterium]|nr:helix-turn-helix transcriptional regulator [Clostridia bacterium]